MNWLATAIIVILAVWLLPEIIKTILPGEQVGLGAAIGELGTGVGELQRGMFMPAIEAVERIGALQFVPTLGFKLELPQFPSITIPELKIPELPKIFPESTTVTPSPTPSLPSGVQQITSTQWSAVYQQGMTTPQIQQAIQTKYGGEWAF